MSESKLRITKRTNWFQLNSVGHYCNELDYDQFVEELKLQVEKSKKGVFRDIVSEILQEDYEDSGKKKKGKKKYEQFEFEMDLVVDETRFNQMCQTAKKVGGKYAPILTYHGTTRPENINKIVKNGYIRSGQFDYNTGNVINSMHGQYYGDGIYSSTKFDVTKWYSFLDQHNSIQLVLNMVFLGNTCYLDDKLSYDGLNTPNVDGCYEGVCGIEHTIGTTRSGKNLRFGTEYHTTTGQFNTLAKPDLSLIVSGNSDNIVPIGILTFKPKIDYRKCQLYLNWKNVSQTKSQGSNMVHFGKFTVDKEKHDKLPTLTFNRVVDDFYTVNLPTLEAEQISKNSRVSFVVPLICGQSPLFTKSFNNFSDSISGTKNIWIYDADCESYNLGISTNLRNWCNKYKDQNKLRLTNSNKENLTKVLDNLFNYITKNEESFDTVYLFINRPVNPESDYLNLVENYQHYFKFHNSVIKLIFIDDMMDDLHQHRFYPLKTYLQTYTGWEKYCWSTKEMPINEIMDGLLDEYKRTHMLNTGTHFVIPFPNGVVGEGLVTSVGNNPLWDTTINYPGAVLYKGEFTEYIRINESLYKTKFQNEISLEEASDAVIRLLSSFSNYLMTEKARFQIYQNVVNRLCTNLINQLDIEIKKGDNIRLAKTTYFRVASILSDIRVYTGVQFRGKWFDRLQTMQFSKSIVKRVKTELIEPIEALETSDLSGLGLRVVSTESSKVEPWLILVDYVSTDNFSVADIFNRGELMLEITDSHNQIINGAQVSLDVKSDDVVRMFHGYLFTKNPYLYIGSQRIALTTVTFVSLVEQIFRHHQDYDNKTVSSWIRTCFLLIDEIRANFEKDDKIVELLTKILEEDDFECYLTETYGVLSICMLLGALTLDKGSELLKSSKYHRFAFATLAETVMRCCRTYIKVTGKDSNKHIRKVLELDEDTDLSNYVFEGIKAANKTNRFYRTRYTNCSPFAVVATLEFLERYHNDTTVTQMLQCFKFNDITMNNFLGEHLPNQKGLPTQLALYIQGMKYHKSKNRQNVKFDDPKKIIEETIDEQKELVRAKQNMKARLEEKHNMKRLKLFEEAQDFLGYHVYPKIFNHREVAELNSRRPLDDQLELMPSGLLKHHCCYVQCPEFLQNFATEEDLKNGKTRHGLYKHMRYDISILDSYVPSYHLIGKSIIRKGCKTYDDFVEQFNRRMKRDKRLNNWYCSSRNKELNMKMLWEQLV